MFLTRILLSVFEFFLTVVMAVLVVYVNYVVMGVVNKDYDEEEELKKGNVAVALLLGALLLATGMMVQKGIYPIVTLVRHYFTSPQESAIGILPLIAYALSHLIMVFVVAVLTVSFSLRFYGKLTKNIDEGRELQKGNVAVGIILACVVLVVAMYVSEGIGSLSKALIPQPSIGRVQVMR